MAKAKLKTVDEPIGTNFYVVGVVESVSKKRELVVYADRYILDDHSNIVFINDIDDGEDFIFAIRSGDWKTVTKYEKDVEEHARCIRGMTLQERLEEIIMKELEREEAEKKAKEEEKAAKEEEEKTAAEKLKESIKEDDD